MGGNMMDLVLDEKIRDWAVVPIAVVMLMFGLLRHFVLVFLDSKESPSLHEVCEAQALLRSRRLRTNGEIIPIHSFVKKRAYFTSPNGGLFVSAVELKEKNKAPQNPLSAMDPSSMMGMMMRHVETIIFNIGQMAWVTTFFSGMVLVKLPFGMLDRFKPMTQRGIEIQTLSGRYVSSLSWYILNTLGLRGIISLIVGESAAQTDMHMMQMQQMQQMQAPGKSQSDSSVVAAGEKEALDLVSCEGWESGMFRREKRLLSTR